jgi:hypothetical protein
LNGEARDARNEAEGHFSRNTTVDGSGVSTDSTSTYSPLRFDATPGGGKMILS